MLFIYLMESTARYESLVDLLFERVEKGKHEAITSTLSLTEIMTLPYRDYRDQGLEAFDQFRSMLMEFPHLKILPLDAPTALLAASVRARYKVRTPDAIQLATALQHGSTAFVTNDRPLAKVKDIQVLLLDDYLSTRKSV